MVGYSDKGRRRVAGGSCKAENTFFSVKFECWEDWSLSNTLAGGVHGKRMKGQKQAAH